MEPLNFPINIDVIKINADVMIIIYTEMLFAPNWLPFLDAYTKQMMSTVSLFFLIWITFEKCFLNAK